MSAPRWAAVAGPTAIIGVLAILIWTGRWIPFSGTSPTVAELEEQLSRDIRGDDRDDNGIRDDVEAWVRDQFGDRPQHRDALLQLAEDYQGVLLNTGHADSALPQLVKLSQSLGCVEYVAGADAGLLVTQLKAVVLDTDIRVRAWLKAYERWEDSGVDTASHPCRDQPRSRTISR